MSTTTLILIVFVCIIFVCSLTRQIYWVKTPDVVKGEQVEQGEVYLLPKRDIVDYSYQFSNNPINIKRFKSNDWLGSVKDNKGKFEEFIHPNYGIRASIKVILANIRATESVKGFVHRIAIDNQDEVYKKHIILYARHLELELGYRGKIKDKDVIKVLRAMIFLEGGAGASAYFNKYMECKQLEKFI